VATAEVGRTSARACEVTVFDEATDRAVAEVTVRFRVLHGPALLGADRLELADAVTDQHGVAAVAVTFSLAGMATIAAEVRGRPATRIVLLARSDRVADAIYLETPPVTVAGDQFEASIRCFDHRGAAVAGGRLELVASRAVDLVRSFSIRRGQSGVRRSRCVLREAGPWTLRGRDWCA